MINQEGNVDFNFHEIVYISDNLLKPIFVYETEKHTHMCSRLKPQTEIDNNMTQLEAISQQ